MQFRRAYKLVWAALPISPSYHHLPPLRNVVRPRAMAFLVVLVVFQGIDIDHPEVKEKVSSQPLTVWGAMSSNHSTSISRTKWSHEDLILGLSVRFSLPVYHFQLLTPRGH